MAYNFNGTNQDLSTGSSPVPTRPFTMSGWFYTGVAADMCIISNQQTSSQTDYVLRTNTSNKLVAVTFSGGVSNLIGVTNYSLNSWQHGCAVFNTNERVLFLNGAQDATDSLSTGGTTSNSIVIASRQNFGKIQFFSGRIAEVGIWNAALNAAEVASLAKGMTCDKVRPQSLVFYAPLVRDLQDVRGGLTITNNNSATVVTHPRVYA